MIMRFRGGGVGHTSTQAATNIFKSDRDNVIIESQKARRREFQSGPLIIEAEVSEGEGDIGMTDGLDAEDLEEGEVDEENDASESELVDYGYGSDGESSDEGQEEEDRDDMELDVLGYTDH